MARGRMLSKDISLDEKVDLLSDDTCRLLFTWLIPHLDVEGRMYGDARLFKAIVAPRRPYTLKKVEKCLTEMEKFGLITRYSFNGNTYLESPNFEKHQPGLQKNKEAKSKLPSRNDETSRVKPELRQSYAEPTLSQVKEKRREVKEKRSIYTDLLEMWNEQRIIRHKKMTKDIKPAINAALLDHSREEIEQAIKNYAVIVNGGEYYLDHRWTLSEFLSRKNGINIERFLDLEIAKSNFKKENGSGANKQDTPRQSATSAERLKQGVPERFLR